MRKKGIIFYNAYDNIEGDLLTDVQIYVSVISQSLFRRNVVIKFVTNQRILNTALIENGLKKLIFGESFLILD
jgi:hypothetical protein